MVLAPISYLFHFEFVFVSEVKLFESEAHLLVNAHSCVDRCHHLSVVNQECHCDPFCVQFNGCCFDYNTVCLHTHVELLAKIRSTSQYIPSRLHRCTQFPFFGEGLFPLQAEFLVVASCPGSWSGSFIEAKCLEPFQVPDDMMKNVGTIQRWFVYDHIGLNFKNIYCAICNGRQPFQVTPFLL